MSRPDAAAYTAARTALAAGDEDAYLALLDEAVEWWELGSREPVVGKAAVSALLARPGRTEPEIEVHDVLASEEHLVALIHARVGTSSGVVDATHAEVLHFNERGLVTKRQEFPADIWSSLRVLNRPDPSAPPSD